MYSRNNLGGLVALGTLLGLMPGCGSGTPQTVAGETPKEEPAKAASAAPAAPAELVWLDASHVLIQYSGSTRASAEVTRTKDEARKLAGEVAAKAKAGDDFAELAKQYSDGPTGPAGGNLGAFPSNRMVPEFSAACAALEVGGVSDPVETQFGFHVIRRNGEVELVSARHILVMHKDSARASPAITRTKEEARGRTQEALGKAKAGADFAELAAEYSDGPTSNRGGDLGAFPRGMMVPAFDEAVFALDVGEISGLVETPFGYHIILRYE